jgi:threonine dehydratase
MPDLASQVKIANVSQYGGNPVLVPEEERNLKVNEISRNLKAVEVHPYAAKQVIAGQASLGFEILDNIEELDFIFCPIGGGGLSTGLALALNRHPKIKIIVVEPTLASDAYALVSGMEPDLSHAYESIADGLRSMVGKYNLEYLVKRGALFKIVSEGEIDEAWKLLWKNGYEVEPSSAVGVAALVADHKRYRGLSIAVVLTGGNTGSPPDIK